MSKIKLCPYCNYEMYPINYWFNCEHCLKLKLKLRVGYARREVEENGKIIWEYFTEGYWQKVRPLTKDEIKILKPKQIPFIFR